MSEIQLLIIEDEAILALDLRARLTREGYHMAGVANNGRKALEILLV